MSRKHTICKEFAERHGISPKQFTGHEIEAVYWLGHSRHEIAISTQSHTARLVSEPTWGLLKTMLDRVYNYAAGSLILYAVGQPSSGEVVARTAVESAINVLYVLNGNGIERLQGYFSTYIATERRQNRLWLDSISRYSDREKQVPCWGLAKKVKALDECEKFLTTTFQQMGVTYNTNAEWPSLFDRFKALGKETAYRTVYAAMCSQAHNDAEDLLNKFFVYSVGISELKEKLALETANFSRMLIYIGLQYYLEASQSFANCFGLTGAAMEIAKGYDIISKLATEIVVDTQA
jgi:hypothetical protein